MAMKRKIYNQLLDWKNNHNGEVALLIEGARRSSLQKCVRKFGEFVTMPMVVHSADWRTDEDGIRYIPLYMIPVLS